MHPRLHPVVHPPQYRRERGEPSSARRIRSRRARPRGMKRRHCEPGHTRDPATDGQHACRLRPVRAASPLPPVCGIDAAVARTRPRRCCPFVRPRRHRRTAVQVQPRVEPVVAPRRSLAQPAAGRACRERRPLRAASPPQPHLPGLVDAARPCGLIGAAAPPCRSGLAWSPPWLPAEPRRAYRRPGLPRAPTPPRDLARGRRGMDTGCLGVGGVAQPGVGCGGSVGPRRDVRVLLRRRG